jgi:hypothetical protein
VRSEPVSDLQEVELAVLLVTTTKMQLNVTICDRRDTAIVSENVILLAPHPEEIKSITFLVSWVFL